MQGILSDRRNAALGGILLALWAVWTIARYQGHWPPDLTALYLAARFYGLGEMAEVYAGPARFFGQDYPQSWTDTVAALGHPGEAVFPYVYPPLWAALVSPIATRIGPQDFFDAAYIVQIGLLAAMPWLAWRILRPGIGFLPFAAVSVILLETSVISAHALFNNQPQITVSFLILLAFERLRAGRPAAAGLILGLAAAIKLSPLVLAAIFLAERQWRAAWVSLATAAALALLSLAVAGPDLHRAFLGQLRLVGSVMVIWDLNISLRSALHILHQMVAGSLAPGGAAAHHVMLSLPAWIAAASTAVFAAGGAALFYLTRHAPEPPRLGHRLAAGYLILTLCGPLSWAHHYLIVLILLPGLLGALRPGPGGIVVLAYGILFSNALSPHLRTAFGTVHAAPLVLVGAMLALFAIFTLSARRPLSSSP